MVVVRVDTIKQKGNNMKTKYKDEKFFTIDQYLISIHPDIWEDYTREKDLWSYAVFIKQDFIDFIDSRDTCESLMEGFSIEGFEYCKEVAFMHLQETIDDNFNEYIN